MQRFLLGFVLFLAVAVASVACGICCWAVSAFVLMWLGIQYHGNYEYYGNYPLLYLGPAAVGLLVPWLAAWMIWVVRRRR
jgi:hypothetical protein